MTIKNYSDTLSDIRDLPKKSKYPYFDEESDVDELERITY